MLQAAFRKGSEAASASGGHCESPRCPVIHFECCMLKVDGQEVSYQQRKPTKIPSSFHEMGPLQGGSRLSKPCHTYCQGILASQVQGGAHLPHLNTASDPSSCLSFAKAVHLLGNASLAVPLSPRGKGLCGSRSHSDATSQPGLNTPAAIAVMKFS